MVRHDQTRGFVIEERCKNHDAERQRAVLAFKRRLALYTARVAKCPACASMRRKFEGTIIVPVCGTHERLHNEIAYGGRSDGRYRRARSAR